MINQPVVDFMMKFAMPGPGASDASPILGVPDRASAALHVPFVMDVILSRSDRVIFQVGKRDVQNHASAEIALVMDDETVSLKATLPSEIPHYISRGGVAVLMVEYPWLIFTRNFDRAFS